MSLGRKAAVSTNNILAAVKNRPPARRHRAPDRLFSPPQTARVKETRPTSPEKPTLRSVNAFDMAYEEAARAGLFELAGTAGLRLAVTPLPILSISSALLNSRSAAVPPIQWESKSRDRRKTAPITPTLESRLQADGYIPTKFEHWYIRGRAELSWRYRRGASILDSRSHAPTALSHNGRGRDASAGFAVRVGRHDGRAPEAPAYEINSTTERTNSKYARSFGRPKY